ncbi:MAG: LmbZ [Parcubacteria group bacterium Gr01-1014_20]|nr:MAG: LmbZ [Parcubacteria group bacterium Gr01-1014_20]
MGKIIKVGIVGSGLMGYRRAEAISATRGSRLVAVTDIDIKKAEALAQKHQAQVEKDWRSLAKRKDVDVVIISVPNKFLAPIAIEALQNGKHLLCEKPFGRNVAEAKKIIAAALKYKRLVKVGFNHRFHAAIIKAKEIFDRGGIGKIMFIRGRYGQGGRKGMEHEWRFSKDMSGGGELLDQGVHLIDLCRFFAGEFNEVFGAVETKFWKAKVEDNAFMILKNKAVTASLHVSATQWKNLFSFEIFGDKGFLTIDGKGGSYGKETLMFGKRKPEFGVPGMKTFEFGRDTSWEEEWGNFLKALNKKAKIVGTSKDGLRANQIVEAIYVSSKSKKSIRL